MPSSSPVSGSWIGAAAPVDDPEPTPKRTTITSGPRRLVELVAVAEIDNGSIATASTMPSDTIESAIASNPTRTPPSLRSVPTLIR